MFGATMLTKKSSVIMLSRLSAYLQGPLGRAKMAAAGASGYGKFGSI